MANFGPRDTYPPTPTDQSPAIPNACLHLEKQLEAGEDLIHRLRDRLQPVLAPRPENPAAQLAAAPTRPLAPLANRLLDDAGRLQGLNELLSCLLEALDL